MLFFCVILCGVVEYFTGLVLELTHDGQRWWDYTGFFLNLHGRICAEGLLAFGIGGMIIVYFVAPFLDNYFRKIKLQIIIPVCVALMVIFISDQLYTRKHPNTGEGITCMKEAGRLENYVIWNSCRYRVKCDYDKC